jgi:hypothetical protein
MPSGVCKRIALSFAERISGGEDLVPPQAVHVTATYVSALSSSSAAWHWRYREPQTTSRAPLS